MTEPRVCALPGCLSVIEPASPEDSRRYCCAAHRKISRKRRRGRQPTGQAQAAKTRPSRVEGYASVGSAPARSARTWGADGVPDETGGATGLASPGSVPPDRPPRATTSPYRRLVPEPRPKWWQRSARPYATRGVRTARGQAPLPPLRSQPEWLWPRRPWQLEPVSTPRSDTPVSPMSPPPVPWPPAAVAESRIVDPHLPAEAPTSDDEPEQALEVSADPTAPPAGSEVELTQPLAPVAPAQPAPVAPAQPAPVAPAQPCSPWAPPVPGTQWHPAPPDASMVEQTIPIPVVPVSPGWGAPGGGARVSPGAGTGSTRPPALWAGLLAAVVPALAAARVWVIGRARELGEAPSAWWSGWREARGVRRARLAAERGEAAAVLDGTALPGQALPGAVSRRGVAGRRGLPRGVIAPKVRLAPVALPVTKTSAGIWAARMGEAIAAALHSLSNNRLRSLLTTVGIVVGVAAVILLVAMGNGMKANFNQEFSKLANQITVTPAKNAVPDGGVPRNLTDDDVDAISDRRQAPSVAAISPAMVGSVTVTAGQTKNKATLVGATANYLEMLDRKIVAGRWFTQPEIDAKARSVVIGQQAMNLLWGSGTDPQKVLGVTIRLSHTNFKIQGVLAADGQNDNAVLVPFGSARSHLVGDQGGAVDQVIVKSTSVETVDQAAREVVRILDERHFIRSAANRDYNVKTFTELLNQSTQYINFLTMFIVAVAAISLFVGGVGVANIMLVSVTERTREIGIRKAVGATRTAILRQFLSEAVMLSGLGGLVGVILGVGLTLTGAAVLPGISAEIPVPILTSTPVLIAFGVSLAIGLLAGGYPANRAARMRPIQALRFE